MIMKYYKLQLIGILGKLSHTSTMLNDHRYHLRFNPPESSLEIPQQMATPKRRATARHPKALPADQGSHRSPESQGESDC